MRNAHEWKNQKRKVVKVKALIYRKQRLTQHSNGNWAADIRLPVILTLTLIFSQHVHAAHPSIFFSASDIPDIRSKANSSHSAIMQPILSLANSLLSEPVPAEPVGADYSGLSLASRNVMALSFAFAATGDSRYLAMGKQYLVSFASWAYWGADQKLGDRDLTLGFMLRACAMAYDWIYDSLSTDERAAVRGALARHAQEMYEAASGAYNSDWANWWPQSFGQNHWDNNNSALGIAALTLEEEHDSSGIWLNHVVQEMRKDSFNLANIGDGTWHEGCLYQNSKLTATMPFYYNLKRLKGIDLLPKNYLSAYALFALYNYLPSERQMALTFSSFIRDWGGWLSAAGYSLLSLAASECNLGYAQWLWDKMGAELGRSSYQAGGHIAEFFYYSPSAAAMPPDNLPLSKTFPDLEGVIWRTGWETDDLTFGLKCGSYGGRFLYNQYLSKEYPFDVEGANLNVGHDHADANTFWLYRGAVTLIGENEGRSLYNDLNSAYQSSSHNTLLVDGSGQYFPTDQTGVYADNDGSLSFSCNTQGYDFVETDASGRYRATNADGTIGPPMISLFARNVLFVRPSYFIIVDNVADSADHEYAMRFHFGDSAVIDTGSGWIRAACAQNNLAGIRTLAPNQYNFHTIDSIRPAVSISPSQQVKRMDFVFAIYPSKASEWDDMPEFSPAIQTQSASMIHVAGDTAFDHIIKHSDAVDTPVIGRYMIDGKAASIGKTADGRIHDLFLAGGTTIADSGGARVLVQSTAKVNALHCRMSGSGGRVVLDQRGEVDLRIYAPGINPESVTLPGWDVTIATIGDYLMISGHAQNIERGFHGKNDRNKAVLSVCNGNKIYFRASKTGLLTIQAFRLDGKRIWRSTQRYDKSGYDAEIFFNSKLMENSVVIMAVDINGEKLTQLLINTFEVLYSNR